MSARSLEAMPRPDFKDVVVLCGAGVSTESPSRLPSGGELALRVFDLALGTDRHPFNADSVAAVRGAIRRGVLRLEVICDLFSQEIPAKIVVSPFTRLKFASPNRLHLALALLSPAAVITPNQDLLLERAGEVVNRPLRLTHLHGRCDRPQSIATTVTRYLQGFSARTEQLLTSLLRGRDLVVVGYSGRDLDIMGSLLRTEPRSVLWVEHGSRSRGSELAPELRAAERRFGAIWTRIALETGDWLESLLTARQHTALRRAGERARPAGAWTQPAARSEQRVAALFENCSQLSKALAVGRVLRHAGLPHDAQVSYARMRRSHPAEARVILAWAEATFERGQFAKAIDAFGLVKTHGADQLLRAQAVLGEVEALRNLSRFEDARFALQALPAIASGISDRSARTRICAEGNGQLAGISRMDGDLALAETAYTNATAQSRSAGEVRGALEAGTWQAEILLARGLYTQALKTCEEALNLAPLINARWLTWAMFVHGEALGAVGDLSQALNVLRQTFTDFAQYDNPMGETWTLLVQAGLLRWEDVVGAGRSVVAAREAASRYTSPLAYATARLLWEEAEVHRAHGELQSSRKQLTAYRQHVRRYFPRGHLWLDAHGSALEVELARDRGEHGTVARSLHVAATYRRLGAQGAARRMTVSAWAASGPDALAAHATIVRGAWRRGRCGSELMALERISDPGYCPLNIWFVP